MKIERLMSRYTEIKNIKLSKESRKLLSKIHTNTLFNESVKDAIENGTWYMQMTSTTFSVMKKELESQLRSFYSIPKNIDLKINSFNSGIMSFDDGIYPEY